MIQKKSHREDFARFFENPSREGLRDLLRGHVGELDQLDFKREWPEWSKLARHVLAFANSGGGCIVAGVAENVETGHAEPTGIEKLVDKADIDKGVGSFLPSTLVYEALDFSYSDSEYSALLGKTFQVIIVDDTPEELPFLAEKAGSGLSVDKVYVRKETASRAANHAELQQIINRRIETGYSSKPLMDLAEHLEHLKALYGAVSRFHTRDFADVIRHVAAVASSRQVVNPSYPHETFDEFVASVIAEKKALIREFIGARGTYRDSEDSQ